MLALGAQDRAGWTAPAGETEGGKADRSHRPGGRLGDHRHRKIVDVERARIRGATDRQRVAAGGRDFKRVPGPALNRDRGHVDFARSVEAHAERVEVEPTGIEWVRGETGNKQCLAGQVRKRLAQRPRGYA